MPSSLSSVAAVFLNDGSGTSNGRLRLAVLAVVAPRAAKFLLSEDLRQLSDTAKATAAQMTDPEVKSALAQIATVLMSR